MKPIIIVGAGMAAYTIARALRKLDKAIPLLIITADNGGFYSKPMLSNAFAQKKLAAQLITQSAVQMAEQLGANIMTGVRVEIPIPANPEPFDKMIRPTPIDARGMEIVGVQISPNFVRVRAHFVAPSGQGTRK